MRISEHHSARSQWSELAVGDLVIAERSRTVRMWGERTPGMLCDPALEQAVKDSTIMIPWGAAGIVVEVDKKPVRSAQVLFPQGLAKCHVAYLRPCKSSRDVIY